MSSLLKSTLNTRCIVPNDFRYVRSDMPIALTDEEVKWLKEKNIRTIVDLREAYEQEENPCRLKKEEGFIYHSLPVSNGTYVPDTPDGIPPLYISMCDDQMKRIIDTIMNAETNVLYFCYAGKDRTGVVSAILLKKLGFDDQYIIDDYLQSKDNLGPMFEPYLAENPEISREVVTPCIRYMREFLDHTNWEEF